MELNLDAVAKALERLMPPLSASSIPCRDSYEKIKPRSSKRDFDDLKIISNITSYTHEKAPPRDNDTQEGLMSRRKTKMLPRHQKSAVRFIPSSTSIQCKVVEASGTGASSVMVSGASLSRRFGDKVWNVNLHQYPNPYVVLNSLPKHYFRKEVISYIASTDHSQGERIERVRDVVLTIVVEPLIEDMGTDDETMNVIGGVVVSCSNHPRTGYVSVVRMKDIKDSIMRVVLPGTLMGPFLKVTLLPEGSLQSKVLKVSAIELAHADSWTERRVIEEPLRGEGDTDEVDVPEKVHQVDVKHIASNTLTSVKNQKTQNQESISVVQDSGSVSSTRSAQEDGESITEKVFLKGTHELLKNPSVAQCTIDVGSLAPSILEQKKDRTTAHKKDKPRVVDDELKKCSGPNFSTNREVAAIPSSSAKFFHSEVESEKSCCKAALQSPLVSDLFKNDRTKNDDDPNDSISKALIASGIKRRLLQDKSIMCALRKEHCDSNFMESTNYSDEKLPSHTTTGEDAQKSFQLLQARNAWESATYWSRRDILLEAMIKSTAICVTIARSRNEVLASLPQPYPLQILIVLSEAPPSEQDCFDLMMIAAHGERRRGRDAELVCRMTDGFACALHPRRHTDGAIQWLLVSVQSYYTQVNEWISELLRLHDDLVAQGEKSLSSEKEVGENELPPTVYDGLQLSMWRPPALRSVLDFVGMFEAILPALRPWLAKNSLHYYGDVQPALRPFIDECDIIRPTSWFQCVLQATIRSVLLALPGANEVQSLGASTPAPIPILTQTSPPTLRRCFVCAVLHQHAPFFAVWQPELQAVKVVLTTAHVLRHIDSLDGLMMDDAGLKLVKAITPHSSGKVRLIKDDFPLKPPDSVEFAQEYSDERELTSPLAFQLLSTALRHSWSVVGLSLPALTSTRYLFDEDTFMDTVMRWGYAFPRTVVLFYCEAEESDCFSAGFVEVFAPVDDLDCALRT